MLALVLAALIATTPDPGQHARPAHHDPRGLLRVEPTYYQLAADSGGDFYFWAPGEFATSGLQLPIDDDAVVLDYGTFDRPHRSVAIPVEADARVLTLFAGAQRKDRAVLVRPDGAIVAADGGKGLQTYSHMLLATIREPAAGTWRLEFDGAGLYSISAHVRRAESGSAPELVSFEYVEMGGRLAHEGWFPIDRELRAGESIQCRAWVAGQLSDVRFAFVSRDGQTLATPKLVSEPEYPDHFEGRCAIPSRPFRVVVSGRDERGTAFRRIEAALRTPE
jgi:hypothetical protein